MCKDCAARMALMRKAIFEAKIAEALGHAAKGAAEIAGIKPKTGEVELREKESRRKPRSKNTGLSGNPAREGNFNQEQSHERTTLHSVRHQDLHQ